MKKLNLNLVGQDGNAFSLLAYFQKEATRAGWSRSEIAEIMKVATAGDYNLLLQTLKRV